MRPDVAVLAAIASGLELQLDRVGWGQPLLLLALIGADLHPLVSGGGVDVLIGLDAPDDADALVLAWEAEQRFVAAVSRDGDEVLVRRRRGDRQVVERAPSWGIPPALRRAYRLPSRASAHPVSAFLTCGWLAAAIEAEASTPAEALALAPALALATELTWEDVRHTALRGGLPTVAPELAAWMDADLLADHFVAVTASPTELLADLRALAGDDVADAVAAELAARRWHPT